MKKFTLLLVLLVCTLCVSAQQAQNKVYDETRNTQEQITQAVAKAKAEGKYVVCQVGGNWCPWCLKFAKYITDDAEIKSFVEQNFIYEHVNYPSRKGDREAQKGTMKRLGNPQRFGFPVFVVLNGEGNVVHIQDSSYLEQEGSYNKEKVMSFFKHWTRDAVEQ